MISIWSLSEEKKIGNHKIQFVIWISSRTTSTFSICISYHHLISSPHMPIAPMLLSTNIFWNCRCIERGEEEATGYVGLWGKNYFCLPQGFKLILFHIHTECFLVTKNLYFGFGWIAWWCGWRNGCYLFLFWNIFVEQGNR